MTRDVIVRPEAEQDLRDAHAWYRDIAPVLGEQFISAVDQAITLASENPLAFQVLHRSLRRVLFATLPVRSFLRRRRIANRGAWLASSGAQSTRCSEAAIVAGRQTPRTLLES